MTQENKINLFQLNVEVGEMKEMNEKKQQIRKRRNSQCKERENGWLKQPPPQKKLKTDDRAYCLYKPHESDFKKC